MLYNCIVKYCTYGCSLLKQYYNIQIILLIGIDSHHGIMDTPFALYLVYCTYGCSLLKQYNNIQIILLIGIDSHHGIMDKPFALYPVVKGLTPWLLQSV